MTRRLIPCLLILALLAGCSPPGPEVERPYTCTLSISCAAIFEHMDAFNKDKLEVLPGDGVILPPTEVAFADGESVYDAARRITREKDILMEVAFTGQNAYIEGINNIYEFDCGPISGWMYRVNGVFPGYGFSGIKLADGDVVEIVYSCDLGRDIGAPEWSGE